MEDYKINMNTLKNKFFLTVLFSLFMVVVASAQVDQATIDRARNAVEQSPISQDKIEERMREKGYNINNVSPEQAPQLQAALEETIKELEAEAAAKAEASDQQPSSEKQPKAVTEEAEVVEQMEAQEKAVEAEVVEKSDEIQERVKEGASVQEAISEETTESLQETKVETGIYGHHIFKNSEISLYRAANDISTPDTYVLSRGDKVRVSIFGPSQADFEYEINNDGYISPTGMPKIFLQGLTIAQAKNLVQNRFSRRYTFLPEQFSLVLSTARTVTINIFGEVQQPGSYTISAINTGLNALIAAGGPKASGSVRNIKLVKGDGTTKILDVYEYLVNPTVQFDFPIDDQDILFVPLSEEIVEIAGAVKRPMKYEMRAEETLEDLIEFAGGYRTDAYKKLVQVSRLGDRERVLIDLNLTDDNVAAEFDMQNGDKVTVRQTPDELRNYVEASGEVRFPGQYNYQPGMTLADLIDQVEFTDYTREDLIFLLRRNLDGTIYLEKLDLTRQPAESIELNVRDRALFYSLRRFVDGTRDVAIGGAVRNPIEIAFDPQDKIKISDLILLAGGLTPNAHPNALLTRRNRVNTSEVNYVEVDVFAAIADTASAANLLLREGDRLTVYTNERYNNLGEVTITGEVRDPNTLRWDPTLTINKMILAAGGLKENASDTAVITRRSTENDVDVQYIPFSIEAVRSGERVIPLQRGDAIRVYNVNTFMESYNISIVGEVRNPETFRYDSDLTISEMILMSGGLKENANDIAMIKRRATDNNVDVEYIRIDLNEELSTDNPTQLQPGDQVRIYDKNLFLHAFDVRVMGEVKNPGTFDFDESLTLQDAIYMAGGLTLKAATDKVEIYRVDFRENKPTRILHKRIELIKESNDVVRPAEDVALEPFDVVIIRTVPGYQLQEVVYINGEVTYPGPYVLGNERERLKDLVKRAGGLTPHAFPEGATLIRRETPHSGSILINLNDVLRPGNYHENIVMRSGDVLMIPKRYETIAIRTRATRAGREYTDSLLTNNSIHMAYQGRRSAKWYIDEFAGGLEKRADKKSVRVIGADGRIEGTRRILFWYDYPTVKEGATVAVDFKPPKVEEEKEERERKPIDWSRTITDSMAIVSSALTIIVLATRLTE